VIYIFPTPKPTET